MTWTDDDGNEMCSVTVDDMTAPPTTVVLTARPSSMDALADWGMDVIGRYFARSEIAGTQMGRADLALFFISEASVTP